MLRFKVKILWVFFLIQLVMFFYHLIRFEIQIQISSIHKYITRDFKDKNIYIYIYIFFISKAFLDHILNTTLYHKAPG